jgi:hypothetical protein
VFLAALRGLWQTTLRCPSHIVRHGREWIDGPAEFINANVIGTYVLLEAALGHRSGMVTGTTLPAARTGSSRARLGADADRYSVIASDLHRLLVAGLPACCERFRTSARGKRWLQSFRNPPWMQADGRRECRSGRIPYKRGQGESAIDTKLPVDVMQVKFDGSFTDIQLARYLFVCKTLGGKNHDLLFPRAQHAGMTILRSVCNSEL